MIGVWSEQDYTGASSVLGDGRYSDMSPYGYHDLDLGGVVLGGTPSINVGWKRANPSDGKPTWGRIDGPGTPTSLPSLTFDMLTSRQASGNFSWGNGFIGLGEPAVAADDLLLDGPGPSIGFTLTGETDGGRPGRSFRPWWQNDAGTITNGPAWVLWTLISNIQGNALTHHFEVWIEAGPTGRARVTDAASTVLLNQTVALPGSYAGDYSRFESWHGGGGGTPPPTGQNEGDITASGRHKALLGYITLPLPEQGGWVVGSSPLADVASGWQ